MVMNSKLYDFLKKCGRTYLPAIVTCWLAIGAIWHIPYTEEVGATMSAIIVCLNTCLGISKTKYTAYNEMHQEGTTEEEGEADA